ncbi:MAG: hypothetical protein C5B49_15305 [Bdellovibrio sp.]|nr:MAG: hypothetical protein C5B49_15305 [Bdellovibrio sp.]
MTQSNRKFESPSRCFQHLRRPSRCVQHPRRPGRRHRRLRSERKRMWPILGAWVSVKVISSAPPEEVDSAIDEAMNVARRLQLEFNFHDAKSSLSRFNSWARSEDDHPFEMSKELREVLQLALILTLATGGAFSAFHNGDVDLGGIAKGYIVDQMVECLQQSLPEASGVVNAGGDLRRFGSITETVHLRLGTAERPLTREMTFPLSAIATSSRAGQDLHVQSSTRYKREFASHLSRESTVVAAAESCMLADAATKVGLFGDIESQRKFCQDFEVCLFAFDSDGNLSHVFDFL